MKTRAWITTLNKNKFFPKKKKKEENAHRKIEKHVKSCVSHMNLVLAMKCKRTLTERHTSLLPEIDVFVQRLAHEFHWFAPVIQPIRAHTFGANLLFLMETYDTRHSDKQQNNRTQNVSVCSVRVCVCEFFMWFWFGKFNFVNQTDSHTFQLFRRAF